MDKIYVWRIEPLEGVLYFVNQDHREASFSYNSEIADSLWEVYSRGQELYGILNLSDELVDGNFKFHLFLEGESIGAIMEIPEDLVAPSLMFLRGINDMTAGAA